MHPSVGIVIGLVLMAGAGWALMKWLQGLKLEDAFDRHERKLRKGLRITEVITRERRYQTDIVVRYSNGSKIVIDDESDPPDWAQVDG